MNVHPNNPFIIDGELDICGITATVWVAAQREWERLYDKHCSGGALHIVCDDGNIEDHHLDFCAQCIYDMQEDSTVERNLWRLLRFLTPRERWILYCGAELPDCQDYDIVEEALQYCPEFPEK